MVVEIRGVVKSEDNNQVLYEATDPKASYVLMNPETADSYSPACIEWVSPDKVDYNVLPPDKMESKYTESMVKHHGVPLSYLQINNVADGAAWYQASTKYPVEVCEMLARYEWGDLKYTTKKEFKNLAKKTKRKEEKSKSILKVKKGPVIVEF